jgi:anti-sigma regulatory factor (Ser/Thr protein kinase)/anti-anti-sigma regulatory factor
VRRVVDRWTLHFDAAERADLAQLRAFVRTHGERAGLDDEALDDLVQAVDEMATNVLVHGYAKQPGPITVVIEAEPAHLVVRLQDEAPLFDPCSWERPDAAADWLHRRPGGFGIPLARGCVDEIYHRPRTDDAVASGNELILLKRTTGAQPHMKMTTDRPGDDGVTVLRLAGDLDAASFEAVIERGRELHAEGVEQLLIDLSEVGYMGSSGLVALHGVALLLGGQEPPDPELGWGAFKNLQANVGDGPQPHVKILGAQGSVLRTLQRTGMTAFIEVFDDEQAALDSF